MTLLDKLFRKSPFVPIIEHAKKVYECDELINPVIKAWLREDWDEIERLRNEISRKENEADQLKIAIRNSLPKSLFYPVPRGDLLRILGNQDNIADAAEDLCVVLTLRKTKIPESFDQYLSSLDARMRRNIKNRRRNINRDFTSVVFHRLDTPSELGSWMENFKTIHTMRMKEKGLPTLPR